MNLPDSPSTLDEFLAALSQPGPWAQRFVVADGGEEVTIHIHRTSSPDLEIRFNGCILRRRAEQAAANQSNERRVAPDAGPTRVTVTDPGLVANPRLRTTWYTGWHRYHAQTRLVPLLQSIASALGARRVVTTGASAGGFSALYFSWHLAGSIAVVANPQTNIDLYTHQGYVNAMRRWCWPQLRERGTLSTAVTTDLCQLYAQGMENSLVLLQNSSDHRHVGLHVGRLLGSLRPEDAHNVVLIADWWGPRLGHVGPPGSLVNRWVKAAFQAPTGSADDLLKTYQRFDKHADSVPTESTIDGRDERLASLLLDDLQRTAQPPCVEGEFSGRSPRCRNGGVTTTESSGPMRNLAQSADNPAAAAHTSGRQQSLR